MVYTRSTIPGGADCGSVRAGESTTMGSRLEGAWCALGSELCGSICKLIASDACVTGYPPYLDRRARKEQGRSGFADVAEEKGLV